jgi:8-oxo-dGTP pyrophosphatase MutT (NUDIX family)
MNRDVLRGWLNSHTPVDDYERQCVAQVMSALELSDCFSKQWFKPGHITASAFVLSPDQQQLLLISHRDFGLWMQPGGHLDTEDLNTFEAAKRELKEEAGLYKIMQPDWAKGILDVDVHNVPGGMKRNEPAHQHFDIRYAFSASSLEVQAASDAKDARWFSIDELINEQSTDASVRRAAIHLRNIRPGRPHKDL